MSFPEKLPFTTFTVGIAAAFQATYSANFAVACAWCAVILVAGFEVAARLLKEDGLNKWKRWGAQVIMVPVVAIVAWLGWHAYRKEFLTEDFRVTFNVPRPNQIGTDRLDLNYVIRNEGSTPLLIEEVIALEIATTDFSNNPTRSGTLCESQVLGVPGRAVRESAFVHPGRKVIHELQNKPRLPQAFIPGDPPFRDDEKVDVAIYEPKTILENEKDVGFRAVSIDIGKASSLTASFDTDPAAWNTHNVTVICGAIKYLGRAGYDVWAVCPAWFDARAYQNGQLASQHSGPAGPKSFAIAAGSSEALCGVRASY
jgi:hypothetical protein